MAEAPCDSCNVDSSSPKFHEEEHVVGDEPRRPGHFDGEEIGGDKRFPVGFQEGAPWRPLASLVGRLDAVFLEDVRDRTSRNLVAEMRQGTFDPRVAPARIGSSHAEHEVRDVGLDSRSPGFLPPGAIVPLARDEFSVPGHDGVRRDHGRDFLQHAATQRLSLDGEPTSFVIGETKTFAAELAFQDAVLLDEVVDDVLLMPVDPSGDGNEEELPRVN